jgi:hypothetical protein
MKPRSSRSAASSRTSSSHAAGSTANSLAISAAISRRVRLPSIRVKIAAPVSFRANPGSITTLFKYSRQATVGLWLTTRSPVIDMLQEYARSRSPTRRSRWGSGETIAG